MKIVSVSVSANGNGQSMLKAAEQARLQNGIYSMLLLSLLLYKL